MPHEAVRGDQYRHDVDEHQPLLQAQADAVQLGHVPFVLGVQVHGDEHVELRGDDERDEGVLVHG